MLSLWLLLILMIAVILLSAQLFSNALEYFGEKLGLSTGVIGSIFAAIATALPETLMPIIAIVAGTSDHRVNEEISVGAILGAPLMLSTLSTSIMAISVIKKRGLFGKISPEKTGFIRDLHFFMIAFLLAMMAMFVPHDYFPIRIVMSILLVCLYLSYIFYTCRASKKLVDDGHHIVLTEPLIFSKVGLKNTMHTTLFQLLMGIVLLLLGAKGFIYQLQHISQAYGISALILSLLIIPIATELPEKVNSVLWVRKQKDTLAFGNITGAMVFQGTLLPALGFLLTPWRPNSIIITGMVVTLIAASWLRFHVSYKGLSIWSLLVNGGLYLIYLLLIFN
jgi:cation:H+ antiporter